MPCFRGIELSIVEASEHSVLPEFPHPDGSSIRLGGLQSSRYSGAVFLSPRRQDKASDRLSVDAQGRADPRISVYIPSVPGIFRSFSSRSVDPSSPSNISNILRHGYTDTNFYFRYIIAREPIGHKFLFFRVVINGRHVVSWGVDLSETLVGAVHQALFEPSTDYQYSDNGVIMTQYGIEARCFRFVSCGLNRPSIANDGGLMEVQAFRAKSRTRRAPQPDVYRGGDKYGVSLISNGLLEEPQMADYYVYHLLDPKDSPYVSFCFHYRSWENLKLLQLAPNEEAVFCHATSAKAPPVHMPTQNDTVNFDFVSLSTQDHTYTAHVDGQYSSEAGGNRATITRITT
ncbi:hypothetical protein SEPCBS119000_002315 [Sporothrix epigloea]|uniref:Uncharacterized protein n=1 Tax=Sporothrix epigloea TaxID=1892477 RepID=A0ABP0DJL7_9PEZI